jgi:hypothetical protein
MPRSESNIRKGINYKKSSSKPIPTVIKEQGPSRVNNQGSSMFRSIKEGFSFGIGNAFAQRIMHTIIGQPSIKQTEETSLEPAVQLARSNKNQLVSTTELQERPGQYEYTQCIKEGGTEEVCNMYLNQL